MKIAFLGDLALFGRFCLKQNRDVFIYLENVAEYLKQHNLVVANLEAPFSEDARAYGAKSAHIRSAPENIDILKYLGITHVSLANNHMGDFGLEGFAGTKNLLEKSGIVHFGTGGNQVKIDGADARVALMGYCAYNTNPLLTTDHFKEGVNVLDVKHVIDDMDANTLEGYVNIISVHSGQEHVPMPSQEDVRFARGLARRSPYVYFGHHPHVIQGVEEWLGSTIFYSLGNFLFDDIYTPRNGTKPLITLSEANKTGLIATVEILGNRITDWSFIPLYLGRERLLIEDEVSNFDMQEINAHLADVYGVEYSNKRALCISEYLLGRKAKRNLSWYLRRLNLNSVGMILNARRNNYLQKIHFKSQLGFLD